MNNGQLDTTEHWSSVDEFFTAEFQYDGRPLPAPDEFSELYTAISCNEKLRSVSEKVGKVGVAQLKAAAYTDIDAPDIFVANDLFVGLLDNDTVTKGEWRLSDKDRNGKSSWDEIAMRRLIIIGADTRRDVYGATHTDERTTVIDAQSMTRIESNAASMWALRAGSQPVSGQASHQQESTFLPYGNWLLKHRKTMQFEDGSGMYDPASEMYLDLPPACDLQNADRSKLVVPSDIRDVFTLKGDRDIRTSLPFELFHDSMSSSVYPNLRNDALLMTRQKEAFVGLRAEAITNYETSIDRKAGGSISAQTVKKVNQTKAQLRAGIEGYVTHPLKGAYVNDSLSVNATLIQKTVFNGLLRGLLVDKVQPVASSVTEQERHAPNEFDYMSFWYGRKLITAVASTLKSYVWLHIDTLSESSVAQNHVEGIKQVVNNSILNS